MSFRLKTNQSLRKSLHRIMRNQIVLARDCLTKSEGKSRDEAVHEARKAFKKVRAALRLVAPHIGKGLYKNANATLRDAGRPLTEVRDAKILIEVTDKLADKYKRKVVGRTFTEVREALQSHARSVRARVLGKQRAFATVRKTLKSAQSQIKQWADVQNKWSSIGDGLRETYRRARDAFAAATDDPQIEKLHEWRKQTKYLRYQLQVLRPIWPERIEQMAAETDAMGELLGDDHDLTLLRQMLTTDSSRWGDSGDIDVLLALIEHRQIQLRRQARVLAERFFEDSPADFARPFKGFWRAWRDESKSTQTIQTPALA
jgi:CHAD domain-containing protein